MNKRDFIDVTEYKNFTNLRIIYKDNIYTHEVYHNPIITEKEIVEPYLKKLKEQINKIEGKTDDDSFWKGVFAVSKLIDSLLLNEEPLRVRNDDVYPCDGCPSLADCYGVGAYITPKEPMHPCKDYRLYKERQ